MTFGSLFLCVNYLIYSQSSCDSRSKPKKLNPESCPHFEKCSANVCPLDECWRSRSMCKNEACCEYLREASKEGGDKRFENRTDKEIYLIAKESLPNVKKHSFELLKQLERASKSGSRIEVPWIKTPKN